MMVFNRLVTALFCIFVVLPLLWLLYAAFLPPEAVLSASLVPTGFSLGNLADLAGTGVGRALLVSILASGLTVIGQLVFGLMAAYALSKGRGQRPADRPVFSERPVTQQTARVGPVGRGGPCHHASHTHPLRGL